MLGATVVVQAGAGAGSRIPDDDFAAAGATIAKTAAETLKDADIVLKVRRPEAAELKPYKAGHAGRRHHGPVRPRGGDQGAGRGRRRRLRHGADAAHHPRAVDGRAVQPGQSRRLPGGDRCRRPVRPRAADDDDRGRHGAGRARLRHGRRASPACRRSRPRGAWARWSRRPTCARRPRSRSSRSAPSSSPSRTRSSSRPRPPPATPSRCRRNIRPSRRRWSPSTSRSRTSSSPPR